MCVRLSELSGGEDSRIMTSLIAIARTRRIWLGRQIPEDEVWIWGKSEREQLLHLLRSPIGTNTLYSMESRGQLTPWLELSSLFWTFQIIILHFGSFLFFFSGNYATRSQLDLKFREQQSESVSHPGRVLRSPARSVECAATKRL